MGNFGKSFGANVTYRVRQSAIFSCCTLSGFTSAMTLLKRKSGVKTTLRKGGKLMKALFFICAVLFSAMALAHPGKGGIQKRPPPYEPQDRVFCDYYSSSRVSGYSLYRVSDQIDLGNAVWTGSRYECDEAAGLANRRGEGIVCARYHNSRSNSTNYSVYRIYDNRDLGKATISTFSQCQDAVRSARRGIFCSTYVKNGQTWWSMYSIRTGEDIGSDLYATLQGCEEQY